MASPKLSKHSQNSVSDAEVQQELEKILATPSFRRSPRLSRFLSYVVDKTLRGEGSEINEYLIGSEVFERGPDYSPTEDSVVRRQAHSLRQKLEKYYTNQGRDDSIRIEVPLGHYIPVFRRVSSENSSTETGGAQRRSWWLPGAYVSTAVAATVILAFALGWRIGRESTVAAVETEKALPSRLGQAGKEIWGPWLSPSREPVICFSNPMTTVVKHFKHPLPEGALPRRILVGSIAERRIRDRFALSPGGHIYMTPSVSQTKMGEAAGAALLANMFGREGLVVRVTQSRFLSWDEFRKANLILLGHTEANPWIEPLLKHYPLQMASTKGALPRRILNVNRREGEPVEFSIDYAEEEDEATVEYALVSMLPGLDEHHELLLIGGLNTQATHMAIEFLTDPASLELLLGELRKRKPEHRGVWRFQLVLKAEVRDKVPTGGHLVLLRIL